MSGRLRRVVAVLAAVVTVVGLATVGLSSRAAVARADASTGAGGLFVPVQDRLLDTRPAYGTGGYTTPMPAGVWRTVQVTGVAGIPSSGVAAVAVNFTVLNDATDGYLNADKDEATPNATIGYLHWTGGIGQTNSGVVAVAADGKIQVKASSATDLIIDVQGYYTSGDPAAGGFVPITQARLVDTRNGTGLPATPTAFL